MLYPVAAVGKVGIISDVLPQELPPNVWSAGNNIRFANGYAEKVKGHISVFGTPGVAPIYAQAVASDTTNFWVYAGLNKIYAWDGGVHNNITRQTLGVDEDYNTDAELGWNGGVIGGIPVLNNGVDSPQMWAPVSAGTPCSELSNWPANTTCSVLRVFKQFLIALDVTKTGQRFPFLVKWSHPADPGSPPPSWDETDPTKLAGESNKLSESSGFIVDGVALRDTFIIYKEDSVWGMQLLTTSDVFRIYKIFSTGGVIATNCAVEFFNGKHAVFGISDIYYHDGQQMKSIISEKVRKRIYGTIEGSAFKKSHVVHNLNSREVLFCYPTTGHDYCNEALVWNYESDTTGFRELPNTTFAAVGIVNPSGGLAGSDQWGLDTQSWDDDTTLWGERLYNPAQYNILACSPLDNALYLLSYSNSFNGVGMQASVERIGIGFPVRSGLPPDFSQRKFISRLWPRITGTDNGVVYVQVGGMQHNFKDIQWSAPIPYEIGVTEKIDCRVFGRMFGVRFYSDTVVDWQLHGYDVEYEVMGRF